MIENVILGLVAVSAALISGALNILLWPVLRRYALVEPSARSSHHTPTPQGGGIGVVAATITVASISTTVLSPNQTSEMLLVLAAAAFISLVGIMDDIRSLDILTRVACQVFAFGIVIAALPAELRIIPEFPWHVERTLMLLGGVWLINLTNFMDGIDWITVAEIAPISGGLAILGVVGSFPLHGSVVSAALVGAILAFLPFNKPVARLFLGDVGSLPLGLLLGWVLILLAGEGYMAAAILLPLYYTIDTSLTLILRFWRGKSLWQAHRDHFYQRAFDRGMPAVGIVSRVFAVNIVLAALAFATIFISHWMVAWGALVFGFGAVVILLRSFATAGSVQNLSHI